MTKSSRQNVEVVVRSVKTDGVETVLEGITKLVVVGAYRIIAEKDGVNTPYAPTESQYLVIAADGKERGGENPLLVGSPQKTCGYLVGIEGAKFLTQCGEVATSGDRCEEHQGK